MKKDIIYISNKNGMFEVIAKTDHKFTIGISTEDIRAVIHCIRSVNSSIWLVKDYGKKASLFLNNQISYKEFVESVGGIKKLKRHKKVFPIELQ